MRTVICDGLAYRSIAACASYHGVTITVARYAITTTGTLNGLTIAYGDEPPEPAPDDTAGHCAIMGVHAEPLLAFGYCVRRMGVYQGQRV